MAARSALAALSLAIAASACSGDCIPAWRAVFPEPLNRSALSAWGSSADNVYVVGGGLGVAGARALALHYDGRRWRDLDPGRDETLWWVWGTPDGREVWMVGERGLVLRWDGRAFTVVPSGTTATLYGVWGAAADDVWIVGGLPRAGNVPDNDVLLRWDGQRLRRDTSPTARGATFFKVWGSSARDVWIAGELGTMWRYKEGRWEDHSGALAQTFSLLTVHGCSENEVYAVGGFSAHRWDGTRWSIARQAPSGANGVACGADAVLVVGNGGLRHRLDRRTGTWNDETREPFFQTDFHGAWVSPRGELWAVGGNFQSPPGAVAARTGVVAYRGCRPPPGL